MHFQLLATTSLFSVILAAIVNDVILHPRALPSINIYTARTLPYPTSTVRTSTVPTSTNATSTITSINASTLKTSTTSTTTSLTSTTYSTITCPKPTSALATTTGPNLPAPTLLDEIIIAAGCGIVCGLSAAALCCMLDPLTWAALAACVSIESKTFCPCVNCFPEAAKVAHAYGKCL
ncbi:hypothetical protein BJ875DRAFT_512718 [Amylocarpus encephaloides]|uniref:Uncharacterized protein n=1 Tax=Amylocarpus encephaloides TaxID=45428 RepID=A0A9P8C5N4_9HELO|nr:hypothetical protein BJ875DRAFT_512718 [Amylocarpus encephaloides]